MAFGRLYKSREKGVKEMTKIYIVRTNYDCMDIYFSNKKKAIKFTIDDNIKEPGRTDSYIREEEIK